MANLFSLDTGVGDALMWDEEYQDYVTQAEWERRRVQAGTALAPALQPPEPQPAPFTLNPQDLGAVSAYQAPPEPAFTSTASQMPYTPAFEAALPPMPEPLIPAMEPVVPAGDIDPWESPLMANAGLSSVMPEDPIVTWLDYGKSTHPDEADAQAEYDLMTRAYLTGENVPLASDIAQSHLDAHSRALMPGMPDPFPGEPWRNQEAVDNFGNVLNGLDAPSLLERLRLGRGEELPQLDFFTPEPPSPVQLHDLPFGIADFVREQIDPRLGFAAESLFSRPTATGTGIGQGDMGGIARTVAEGVVPETYEELALELIPGIGFVPDIARGTSALARQGVANALTNPNLVPEGAVTRTVAPPARLESTAIPGTEVPRQVTPEELLGLSPASEAEQAGLRYAGPPPSSVGGDLSTLSNEELVAALKRTESYINRMDARGAVSGEYNPQQAFLEEHFDALERELERRVRVGTAQPLSYADERAASTARAQARADLWNRPAAAPAIEPPSAPARELPGMPRAVSPTEGEILMPIRGAATRKSRPTSIPPAAAAEAPSASQSVVPPGSTAAAGVPSLEDQLAASLAMMKSDPNAARTAFRESAETEARAIGEEQKLKGGFYRTNNRLKNRVQAMKEASARLAADETGSLTLPAVHDVNLTDELTAVVGLPRTLKATLDISAPGRQGLALAFRHPIEWAQSWTPMIRAWASDEGMQVVNKQITEMAARWAGRIPGGFSEDMLHFYRVGADAPGLERVPGFEPAGKGLVSGAVRKIPGLENSERAYATFLNYQKAKTFDTMATALRRAGVTDAESYKRLGNIIDHATGYGGAPLKGRFEGQAFFSQRYTTSRFQFLVDPIVEGIARGDWRAAKAATENLVAFAGGMASILYLGNETGAWDATLDPRSSDFGKVRIGPMRHDFGAGFLPLIRTAARAATGEAKSARGGIYDINKYEELAKFFQYKLAPIPSQGVSRGIAAVKGEPATNPIGEPMGPLFSKQTLFDLFMPLIIDSVKEAWETTGDPLATGRAFASELVGGGTSTYEPRTPPEMQDALDLYFAASQDAFEMLKETEVVGPYAPLVREADSAEEFETTLAEIVEAANQINPRLNVRTTVQRIKEELGLTDLEREVKKTAIRRNPDIVEWLESGEYEAPVWMYDYLEELRGVTP